MAGYVCTVAGGNGGVGKTTTVINVATTLGDRGHEVAVVDADLGMPYVGEMLGVDHGKTLHDILAGRTTCCSNWRTVSCSRRRRTTSR